MRVLFAAMAMLVAGILPAAMGQVPQGTGLGQNFRSPEYRITPEGKKILDYIVSGASATNIASDGSGGGGFLVHEFEFRSFRNGDPKAIQVTVDAPECKLELGKRAWDEGPLQIYTPTTNLFVKGVGFTFLVPNRFLIVSNQVETDVVKAMIKSPLMTPAKTNTLPVAPEKLRIFADFATFDFQSNTIKYAGNVHLIDPQLDLTSHLLTIQLTTNGTVESMLAEMDVVLTTFDHGQATGRTGRYTTNNGVETMNLSGNATWRNGDERAWADQFTYDSQRHLLTGTGNVKVNWPNESPSSPHAAGFAALRAGTNGYRKVAADFAILQFPLTNGPVESMHARGHVTVTNEADHTSADAERADYERYLDRIDLTGHPVWRNPTMQVAGDLLMAEIGAKVYHAETNAHFKMLTGGSTNPAAPGNQWVYIDSTDMVYHTNEAKFMNDVKARVVQNGKMQEELNCVLLTMQLSNATVKAAFASGNVSGRTAPDRAGVVKTIFCQQLNAYPSEIRGRMKSVDAHDDVVIEEISPPILATTNRLNADNLVAYFSQVTNRIETATADGAVIIDQFKNGQQTHATSRRAVYTAGTNDEVRLTGTPVARNESYTISGSEYLIWQPKISRFGASGEYKIVPNKPLQKSKTPF